MVVAWEALCDKALDCSKASKCEPVAKPVCFLRGRRLVKSLARCIGRVCETHHLTAHH